MIGLAILFFFGVYLLMTLWVTSATTAWARRNNRSQLKWGGLVAFVMYNLVFWDWLPTVVAHQYYCATEAGFWVYKTPEQWKAENPGVAETLSRYHLPEQFRVSSYLGYAGNDRYYQLPDGSRLTARYDGSKRLMLVDLIMPNGSVGYWLNERFIWTTHHKQPLLWLPIDISYNLIMDNKNTEILVKQVTAGAGYGNMMVSSDWRAMKFWMSLKSCQTETYKNFYKLETTYEKLGDKK